MGTHEEQAEKRRLRAEQARRVVSLDKHDQRAAQARANVDQPIPLPPSRSRRKPTEPPLNMKRLEAQAVRDMATSRARTLEGLDYAAQKPDTYRIGGRREDTRPRRKVKTQRAAATPTGTRARSQRVVKALGRKPNAMTWRQFHAIAQRAPWALTSKLDGPDRTLSSTEVSRLKSAHDQLASDKLTSDAYLATVRRIIDAPARASFHNTGGPAALEAGSNR